MLITWKFDKLQMSRILLFGSTGFLGKSILKRLAQAQHEIFTLNRSVNVDRDEFSFCGNILDSASYANILRKIDPSIVITTPWTTTEGFWNSDSNYEYMRATIALAEFSFSGGVERFLGLGSSAEYGETVGAQGAYAKALNPSTKYGQSKAEAGLAISEMAKHYKKDFNWLRIFQAYGPNESSSRLIPQVIHSLSSDKVVKINNASKVLDWIHSDDVASAVAYSLNTEIEEHFLDVGTAKGTSVFEVVEKIALILGANTDRIDISSLNSKAEIFRLVSSPKSALFESGWHPIISLEKGLIDVVNSCEN